MDASPYASRSIIMQMILVLRVISQLCQCFEDRQQKQKETEEAQSYPLYLRNRLAHSAGDLGATVSPADKEEFLKTIETVSSRSGDNAAYKELIAFDTKRADEAVNYGANQGHNEEANQEISIPDIYLFPTDAEENATSNTKKDTDENGSPANVPRDIGRNQADYDINEEIPQRDRLSIPQRLSSRPAKNHLMILIQEQSEAGQHIEEVNFTLKEGEEKQQEQEGDDDQNQQKQEQKQENFQYMDHLMGPNRKHLKTSTMFDLETRVKRYRSKKKRNAKAQPDSGTSPYRVNLPKDLHNFGISHRPAQ